MNEKTEAYLIDYIAVGIIGFAVAQAIASNAGFLPLVNAGFAMFGGINWGKTIGGDILIGILAFIPAGFVAGYSCYKLLKAEGKREGLTGSFMSFLVYLIITLIMSLGSTGIYGADYGTEMQLWVVLMVFALIFLLTGGFLADMIHGMKMSMPSFLRLQFQRGPQPPPPPANAATTCPSCGGPLRYIEQYKRWYCDKEQKYV